MINVTTYGATGNGTTDDTTSIQNAFNAVSASGDIVYFPKGKYLISSTISIPSLSLSTDSEFGGITVYGDGKGISVITCASNIEFFTCIAASGVDKFNLQIREMSMVSTTTTLNNFHIRTQNINSVHIYNVEFWSPATSAASVAGVHLVGSVGVGNTFYGDIEKCTFIGSSIWYDNVNDGWVRNNVIQGITGASNGERGFGFVYTGSGGNIKIHDNHIYPTASGGILLYAGTGMSICDNFFDYNPYNNASIAIQVLTATKCLISDNIFNLTPAYSLALTDLTDSIISNNIFSDTCSSNGGYATINMGKNVTGCNRNVISGNQFRQNTGLGTPIYAMFAPTGAATGNVLSNNQISGNGYRSPATSGV